MALPDGALFGRRMRLQVGPIVFDDAELGPELGDPAALRVGFKVRKKIPTKTTATAGAEPPALELAIYNLAERTRRQLDELVGTKARGIALDAGYGTDVGVAFRGEVVTVLSGREGTEWVTRISGRTGHTLSQTILNDTLPPGATKQARLQKAIDTMARDNPGVSFTLAAQRVKAGDFGGALESITQGVTMTGRALDQFRVLAKDLGLDAWVDDNEFVALAADEVRGARTVVLTAASGLIAPPSRVFDEKDPAKLIVRAMSLLQWRFALGGVLELGSAGLSGFFRVRAVVHTGDTHGSEWSTEVEAVAVKPYDPLTRRVVGAQLSQNPGQQEAF